MPLLNDVIVGVDGSEGSQHALFWALNQAPSGRIHAIHGFSPAKELFAAAFQINLDPVRAEHQRLLETEWTAPATNTDVKITTRLVDANPARALLDGSKHHNGIPIVIGHQGHGRWSDQHVGDVASRLLHLADVPLIMTNPAADSSPIAGSVAVCLKGTDEISSPHLQWAAQLAAESGLPLQLLSAALPVAAASRLGHKGDAYKADDARILELTNVGLEHLLSQVKEAHPTLEVSSDTASGDPTEALAELLEKADPGLVVLGNHHHSKLGNLFAGGVARHLPPLLKCPVAAIPIR